MKNICREKYFAQPFFIPEGGAKYFHAPWAFVVKAAYKTINHVADSFQINAERSKAVIRDMNKAIKYQANQPSGRLSGSWSNGIVYFWLRGQLLCKAQRRDHSLNYVTGVVSPQSDCLIGQKIRFHLVNYLQFASILFFSGLSLTASQTSQACTAGGQPLFGYMENATLVNIKQHKVASLVDSGATTTALDARNIRMHIKRNGSRWVYYDFIHRESSQKTPMHQPVSRVARIITHKGAPSERAVVRNTIKVGKITRIIETSLISRSNFPQQLLIGRNFLKDTALIDAGKRYLQERCP